MRLAMLCACTVLSLALVASTEGQGKGKKLPALAHDATLVKIEEKKGTPTKVYFECSEEDGKKLGYQKGDHLITKNTKFIFVGPDGEKTFTHSRRRRCSRPRKRRSISKRAPRSACTSAGSSARNFASART
jgi:hypothetical protein